MKFDYCIGNPPYQGDGHQQLYTDFYLEMRSLSLSTCLIFPVGWQEPKNANGLGKLNKKEIKEDPQIVVIKNISGAFPGIAGAELTNIIIWKKDYDNGLDGLQRIIDTNGNEQLVQLLTDKKMIQKPEILINIIHKVNCLNESKFSNLVYEGTRYGLRSYVFNRPDVYNIDFKENAFFNCVKLYGKKLGEGRTSKYMSKSALPEISPLLDTYKIFIPKAWGNESTNYLGGSYSDCICAKPGDCCTEMYLEIGPFSSSDKCKNACKYVYTKFFRAIFYNNKWSQNIGKLTFSDIPIQDFTNNSDIDWSKSVAEIDRQLYKKYDLNDEEIEFIEKHIQAKELK